MRRMDAALLAADGAGKRADPLQVKIGTPARAAEPCVRGEGRSRAQDLVAAHLKPLPLALT